MIPFMVKSIAAAALSAAFIAPVAAQDYPTKVVTIVSPGAAGGSFSIYAQLLADGLAERFGRPFIVENRPGAGTVIGVNHVARAQPDGHTLLLGASSGLAINVSAHKQISYDVLKDFAPVSLFASTPQVLLVNADLPIHSVADIVKISRAKPGSLTFSSNGPGTVTHLSGEMMQQTLGIQMLHVPYKSIGQAVSDVAAGHVSMMFTSMGSANAVLGSKRVRIIGLSSKQPLLGFPEIRPLAEIGVPGFDSSLWYMVAAPAKTPKPIVELLHREIDRITQRSDVLKKIASYGAVPIKSPPPHELTGFLATEIERWRKIVTASGLAGKL